MHYKIGEVSKILDIPIDTLRYFDKKGIVSPSKNTENNYRFYEPWDINFLIEYKRYRGYEFNINETKEILHKDSMEELQSRFSLKLSDIDEKIKFYMLMKKKAQKYMDNLKEIPDKLNRMQISEMPELYYFVHRYSEYENDSYQYNSELDGIFEKWIDYFPFTDTLLTIRKDDFSVRRQDNVYQCGFGLSREYIKAFQIPINNYVKQTNRQKCATTIICAGEKHTFHVELLNPLFKYIAENNYQLNGDIIGSYLARVHEGSEYLRYIEVWAPIAE